jgi:hypothetical protein
MTPVPANCEDRATINPMNPGLLNFCGELPEAVDDSLSVIRRRSAKTAISSGHLRLAWNTGAARSLRSPATRACSTATCWTLAERWREHVLRLPGDAIPRRGERYWLHAYFPDQDRPHGSRQRSREIGENSLLESMIARCAGAGAYYYSVESRSTDDGAVATQELPADFFSFCPCILTGPTTRIALGFADGLPAWFNNPQGDSKLQPWC